MTTVEDIWGDKPDCRDAKYWDGLRMFKEDKYYDEDRLWLAQVRRQWTELKEKANKWERLQPSMKDILFTLKNQGWTLGADFHEIMEIGI